MNGPSWLRCHPTGHRSCREEWVTHSESGVGSIFCVPGTALSRGTWASRAVSRRTVCGVARLQPGDGCRTVGAASTECHSPAEEASSKQGPGAGGASLPVGLRVRVRALL